MLLSRVLEDKLGTSTGTGKSSDILYLGRGQEAFSATFVHLDQQAATFMRP